MTSVSHPVSDACWDVSGILIGTLTMEMGGKVSIVCEKTGYRADIEFKLKVSGWQHENVCTKLEI